MRKANRRGQCDERELVPRAADVDRSADEQVRALPLPDKSPICHEAKIIYSNRLAFPVAPATETPNG
jgi:hypothetical protein